MMKLSVKKCSTLLGLVLAAAATFGVLTQVDSRYAKAEAVKQLAERLEQKIIQDRADYLQERMWKLEDRYGTEDKMPQEIRDEYRCIKAERERLLRGMKE